MSTATAEPQSQAETDDSKRLRLTDAVRELAMLRRDAEDIQKQCGVVSTTIYKLAVEALQLVPKPDRYGSAGEQFHCDGFVVTVGAMTYETLPPKVMLAEIGNLPRV